ncbi:MAG: chemotaxis protein CheW [Gammaproteobacteria bacterium]|nr:chemotaxis protein CheW [Gammaproteobacteria bacterium]MDH5728432.1 chemotaxis protein CheW [Gammaproteobacteria bacterium]
MANTAEDIKKVLSEISEDNETLDASHQYLSFLVDSELYAFSVLDIKEIIEYTTITRIPMTPKHVRGVTNLRGNVVPIIDLAARLDKASSDVTKRTCVIITEIQAESAKIDIGVVIDAINEVFALRQENIEPAPSFGAGIRPEFISGMGKVNDSFVVLLNTEKVLNLEELSELVREQSKKNYHNLAMRTKQMGGKDVLGSAAKKTPPADDTSIENDERDK